MLRLHAPFVALLVLVACSIGRPLYVPEQDLGQPANAGKGFVSARADHAASPMSLTASDGSGLRLLQLTAEATVDDPLATTTMELRFRNPKAEVIEGKFELALPPGAAITRFAMMVGGAWQEAEVVERQKGRVVYESFMHQRRDPALLEQETGNRFGVRVFPIPASGEAHLRVTYVQAFDEPTLPYRLALRGLPIVGEIAARVGVKRADNGEVVWTEHHVAQQRPREDLVVPRDASPTQAWRVGDHVIARVAVPSTERDEAHSRSFAILFDTSASRAVDFAGKIDQLYDVIAQLGRHVDANTKLVVLPFDQDVGAPVYVGPLSGFADSDARSKLQRRQALGASDLEHALAAAAKQTADRVVVVTDGMITAGKREPAALSGVLRRLADAGTRRVDVVAGRDRRDDAVLHALVTELPRSGVVIDASRSPEDIAFRLVRPTAPRTKVNIAGAKRVWPAELRGVQAGDAVLVYAEVERAGKALDVTLDPAGAEPVSQRIALTRATDPGFEQAWVRSDVNEQLVAMAATGNRDHAVLRNRLAALSVEHRILNELTAFIVLETEEDYARFGIERTQDGEADVDATPVKESEEPADEPPPAPAAEPPVELRKPEPTVVEPDQIDSADYDDAPMLTSRREESVRYEKAPRRRMTRAVRPLKFASVALRSARALGGLRAKEADRMGKVSRAAVEGCWFSLGAHRRGGNMTVELHIRNDGWVERVELLRTSIHPPVELRRCMDTALRGRKFSPSSSNDRRARYSFALRPGEVEYAHTQPDDEVVDQLTDPDRFHTDEASYAGPYAEVKRYLRLGEVDRAWRLAWSWRRSTPDDLLALVAIGEVAHAKGREDIAVRAYGSIAELYPSSAPMLRFAAGRLETLGSRGLPLAVDVLEEAQRQRPDHPSSHRAFAWALVKAGRYAEGFDALVRGYDHTYPDDRFASAVAELGEELRIVGAVWMRAEPGERRKIEGRLADFGLTPADEPSLRFVLSWETDTNDVDLHVQDGEGSRAWYARPHLESGGELLADVTNGYGPESFVIDGKPKAYPYYLAVHYYANGPMGYGMGHVQAIHHDGRGNLDIETLPFVAMKQDAKLLVGAIHGD